MTEELPMPLLPKDWIAATMHWPDAERGAYVSLLCFQWVNGYVPRDVSQLARITGSTEARFEQLWQAIGAQFEECADGLRNKRVEEQRKQALALRDAHSRGATLANERIRAKRAQRARSTAGFPADAQRDASVDARALLSVSSSESSSSDSSEEKNSEEKTLRARKRSANAQRTKSASFYDEDFLRFKLAMPERDGGHGWTSARHAWEARKRDGYKPEAMIGGAERFARYADTHIAEKRFVMTAAKFLGPDLWFLQAWEVAANDDRWSPPSDELKEVGRE